MTFNICSFCVSLIILYVDHCYFAILIILKTRFTFRSISDRSRLIPWCPDKEEKMYQMFMFFAFIQPCPCRNEMDMGLSCAGSHPSRLWNSGGPVTLRDPGIGSPEKEGSAPFGTVAKGYVCQPHRPILHYHISKQERLLITPAKESCSVFERSIFKRETTWAVGWFNTC